MKTIINLSLLTALLISNAYSVEDEVTRDRIHSVKKAIASVSDTQQKELGVADGFMHMFKDGTVTGQVRALYSEMNYKKSQDVYASAIGGFLKYELAEYKGFSAGVEFVTTYDVDFLSGEGLKRNDELSSQEQNYTQMNEAYLHYNYEGLNLRVGRQTIDTPLADSDDIRMVANSFEAYLASFSYENISFVGAALISWQGADAGLDDPWSKTGEDGTYFGGIIWSDDFIDASLWYYNINGISGDDTANNSYYGDFVVHLPLSEKMSLHTGVQYLQQEELDKSNVSSKIYGAMAELVVYDIGFNLAYNHASKQKDKQSFSGFGGGTLFTNMDNMILDNISLDREVDAVVTGLSYEYKDFNFLYAYGDFKGSENSLKQKEHIVEQNLGVSYEKDESLSLGAILTTQVDKENTNVNGGDWTNLRVLVAYNF